MRSAAPIAPAVFIAASSLALSVRVAAQPPAGRAPETFHCIEVSLHHSADHPGREWVDRMCYQYTGFGADEVDGFRESCHQQQTYEEGSWGAGPCPRFGLIGVCCSTVLDLAGGTAVIHFYPDWTRPEAEEHVCRTLMGRFAPVEQGDEEPCIETAQLIPGSIQPEGDLVLVKNEQVTFGIEHETTEGLYRPVPLPAVCRQPRQGPESALEDVPQRWGSVYVWWSCPTASRKQQSGANYTTAFPTAGIHEVEARLDGDPPPLCHGPAHVSRRRTLTVVEVHDVVVTSGHGSVLTKGEASGSTGVGLAANIHPSPAGLDPERVSWRVLVGGSESSAAGTLSTDSGLTTTYTQDPSFVSSEQGDITIQARAGEGDEWKSVSFTVAEVDGVFSQVQGIDNGEILYAGEQYFVDLRANVAPDGACLDPGRIEWELVIPAAGGLTRESGETTTFVPDRSFASTGQDDVVVRARAGAGDEWSTFALTLAEVVKVEWKAIHSPLDSNPPEQGGGQRIFPGRSSKSDPVDRMIVQVVASVRPKIADLPVYFSFFDVDDTTPASVDPGGVIDGGSAARDNYDGRPLADLGAMDATNPAGIATVREFQVSLYPGDNYRVAAYFSDLRAESGIIDDLVPANSDPSVAEYPGTFSNLLTVWRRLHVENDSMPTVPEGLNVVTGTIASVTPLGTVPPAGSLSRDRSRASLTSSASLEEHLYEGGSLTVPGAGTFVVITNTSDTVTVAGAIPASAAGQPFELRDDDDPGVLPAFDLFDRAQPLLTQAFAEAFVEPVKLAENENPDVDFALNLSAGEVQGGTGWRQSRDCPDLDPLFWCHLLVSGFQSGEEKDWDPDGVKTRDAAGRILGYPGFPRDVGPASGLTPSLEDHTAMISNVNRDSQSAILLETQRDAGASGWPCASVMHDIVHEIGHSVVGHPDGALMTEGSPSHIPCDPQQNPPGDPVEGFLPETLRAIRMAAEHGW